MRVIEGLSHVTIAAPDIEAAWADYEHLLQTSPVRWRDAFVFATGNVGVMLRASMPGEAAGLRSLTFRTADLGTARQGLARCGLPSAESDETGESAFDASATSGLPIALTSRALPHAAVSQLSLDHIVIRTPNPERAIALYGGRLGLDMRLDRSNPAWNARLMFFRCGDTTVEIAHVLSGGVSDASDTFGGLSWRVPDIEAEHARLASEEFEMSPVRTGRRPGSKVCTVRTRTADVPTILLGVTPRESTSSK